MFEMKKITIIIPTLNEAKNIGKLLDAIPKRLLNQMGYSVECLVVDGGSTDGTTDIAAKKGARVLIVRKRGYGLAYMVGFLHATGDIIVTLDADMTYPPESIPLLVRILERYDYDFVSTNRLKKFETHAFSQAKLLGNKLINILTFLLYRLRIGDTQSGMWCFRKNILKTLRLMTLGMEFSTEIKLEAFRRTKAVEIPIFYRRRMGGTSKIRVIVDGIRIVLFLFYKRIQLLLGF